MSDKIPNSSSLQAKTNKTQNSDVFVNPESTGFAKTSFLHSDREKINTDDFNHSQVQSSPSLGENNHLIALHSSEILPPLHRSASLNKAVISSLLTLRKNEVFANTKKEVENGDKKDAQLKKSKKLINSNKEKKQVVLSANRSTFGKGVSPLRYELHAKTKFLQSSGLTPCKNFAQTRFVHQVFAKRSKAQVELRKRENSCIQTKSAEKFETRFENKKHVLLFDQKKSKEKSVISENLIGDSTEKVFSTLCKNFVFAKSLFTFSFLRNTGRTFDAFNTKIRSQISREFVLVTINLLFLSVFTIAQRTGYGKKGSVVNGRTWNTMHRFCTLCESKLSNITPYSLSSTGGEQEMYQTRVGKLNPVRENSVGVFEAKPCVSSDRKNSFIKSWFFSQETKSKNEQIVFVYKGNWGFSSLPEGRWKTKLDILSQPCTRSPEEATEFFLSNRKFDKNLVVLNRDLIRPWYCMRGCHTLKNKVVATRTFSQIKKTVDLDKQNQIQGVDYSLPFYNSYQRILAESDTIPEKKESVNQFKKGGARASQSSIYISQSAANKSFYKYGLSLLFTDKKRNLSQGSKEERTSLDAKTSFLQRQLDENGVHQIVSQTNECDPIVRKNTNFIQNTELGDRAISDTNTIQVRKGYILLEKRKSNVFASPFEKRKFVNTQPLTWQKEANDFQVQESTAKARNPKESSSTPLKSTTQPNPFCTSLVSWGSLVLFLDRETKPTSIEKENQPIDNSKQEQREKASGCLNTFLSSIPQAFFPVVGESQLSKYSYALSKINNQRNTSKDRANINPFFPLGSAWSHSEMNKLDLTTLVSLCKNFAQTRFVHQGFAKQNEVQLFRYVPDNLVRKSYVSGYKFPELEENEISYLFRKRAVFLYCSNLENKTFLKKLLVPLRTPFRKLKSGNLVKQAVSTPFLANQDSLLAQKVNLSRFSKEENVLDPKRRREPVPVHNYSMQLPAKTSFLQTSLKSVDRIKMQYTQVNLDELKEISSVFKKLGQNFEEYLRQPKDSLPALIISPSLEDDREIEEEGIRIFRKRDLLKQKEASLKEASSKQKSDDLQDFSSLSSPKTASSESEEIISSAKTSFLQEEGEMENHQLLVRNVLLEAQEEMDKIAEQEETDPEKEKQVLPPLTRLEALYTIRDREERHEKGKELRFDTTPSFDSEELKLESESSETKQRTKHTSLPLFERLFLYSEKSRDTNVEKQSADKEQISTKPKFLCALHNPTFCKGYKNNVFVRKTESATMLPKPWDLTRWVFSTLGETTIGTDRKHSFFGELSLPSKKLTAQEQKQIFQQKANPLVKARAKDIGSAHGTVPLSLVSKLSALSQAKDNKIEVPRFQVGPGIEKLSVATPNLSISKKRVYFYDIRSQTKLCQITAPKIKNTPLQSPISHRALQPKRMETSTFRVLPKRKGTYVVPRITQKDWNKIMEWQLKKYFVEEEKRLFPFFSLALNKQKRFKRKQIHLYLPWISIRANLLHQKSFPLSSKQTHAWPLTRLDLSKEGIQSIDSLCAPYREKSGLSSQPFKTESRSIPSGFAEQHSKHSSQKVQTYWRFPTQQKRYATTKKAILNQTKSNQKPGRRNGHSKVILPQNKKGIYKNVSDQSILFESVTKYSWLFVYTFLSVFIFRHLFILVYKVGLEKSFLQFLNSDFGRTVTSEEFRYSVQNPPLKQVYKPTKRLNQLFGLERNKVQLLDIVWFLRNNCQGRHDARAILLVGPPGVEHVSVVQAIAGEANLPVVVQSLENIAKDNEPQRKLEQVYKQAQKNAPCVLFLDQLDTVGARRDQLFTDNQASQNGNPLSSLPLHQRTSAFHTSPDAHLFESKSTSDSNPFQDDQDRNGNKDAENSQYEQSLVSSGKNLNVVLRLLTILDGVTQSNGVLTVASARDMTKLDPALLRPKRFDRRIYLSLPNYKDRIHLFKMKTQSIGHSHDMPWNYLSLQTEEMSATEIRSAINYSLLRAILRNSVHTVETLEYGISCVKSLTEKRAHLL